MYAKGNRHHRLRSRVVLRSFLLIPLSLLSITCGGPKPSDEDWQNPEATLWVTVQSMPAEAEVYGVADGKPATLLGRTPITVKFWKANRTTGPVLWQSPAPEAPMGQFLKHQYSEAMVQTTVSAGSQNRVAFRSRAGHADMNRERADFHCFVIKPGYEPYLLKFAIEDEAGYTDCPNVFSGHKEYLVELEPLESE